MKLSVNFGEKKQPRNPRRKQKIQEKGFRKACEEYIIHICAVLHSPVMLNSDELNLHEKTRLEMRPTQPMWV